MANLQGDDSKSTVSGGEVRKWSGRLASFGAHFLTVASTTVLGGVLGLIVGSWVASSRAASIPAQVAGRTRDFAPDFEPEISILGTWVASLAGCGLVGLLVGLVAGSLLVRHFAASRARKQTPAVGP